MLKLAVQAKGRLNEKTLELLADSGLRVIAATRSLIARVSNFPLEVLYLRDDDIPQAVAMGVADLGIVGENEVAESGANVSIAMRLGFGQCRISLAVPKTVKYPGIKWFEGKSVATSYPSILSRYFEKEGINARIHKIAGSVEVAPSVGMADAIFDIVSTGGTLIQNGLIEVERVFESEAVLIMTPQLDSVKTFELEKIKLRFKSNIESRGYKYILLNIPASAVDKAVKLIPGMKSPTLIPLAAPEWLSMQVVLHEDVLWDKIESLKEIGAEDIIVLSLENIIR